VLWRAQDVKLSCYRYVSGPFLPGSMILWWLTLRLFFPREKREKTNKEIVLLSGDWRIMFTSLNDWAESIAWQSSRLDLRRPTYTLHRITLSHIYVVVVQLSYRRHLPSVRWRQHKSGPLNCSFESTDALRKMERRERFVISLLMSGSSFSVMLVILSDFITPTPVGNNLTDLREL
jgi:hypothetical protein